MKTTGNNSVRASALQITFSIALLSISAILLASSFKAAPSGTGGLADAKSRAPFAQQHAPGAVESLPADHIYDFDIIAQTGQGGLTAITQASINDNGDVAFVGTTAAGQGLYVGNGVTAATNINPSFVGGTRTFTSPQITNGGLVVARDRVSGSPPTFFARIWDGQALDSYTPVAVGGAQTSICDGGLRAGEVCIMSPPDCPIFGGGYANCVPIGPQPDFSAVITPRINNNNQVVFLALDPDATHTLLATPSSGGNFNTLVLGATVSGAPVIADDGKILFHQTVASGPNTFPIKLYNYDLTSEETIADSSQFTELGNLPGISDDGSVVVFQGTDRTCNGPGIFARVRSASDGHFLDYFRIAGFGDDLGYKPNGDPIYFTF